MCDLAFMASIQANIDLFAEARRLEVRCGMKKPGEARKGYVHMLNGTLCATERALCCIVENYQTEEVSLD